MRGDGVVRRALLMLLAAASLSTLAAGAGASQSPPSRGQALQLRAEDGVVVHAIYRPAVSPKALILLFHQAGSSKAEYAAIAPRLAAAGYASLAIDQRSGGTLFGRNETAAGVRGAAGYADAKQDLLAALHWAESQALPIVLWGSSYSASLVFIVAAQNPGKIAAVLAFSPGEYLGPGAPVRAAAAGVDVPIFVTSAQDSAEVAAGRTILDAAPAKTKVQFIPVRGGVHGSSTLIASRNPSGEAAVWKAVLDFLGRLSA